VSVGPAASGDEGVQEDVAETKEAPEAQLEHAPVPPKL
jgi:hypothetical protein